MRPNVVVPTRDRADWNRQHTLRQLLSAGLRVSLVVPRGQVGPYKKLLSVHEGTGLITIVRCPFDGIGRVRRWITRARFQYGTVIMLDDDLQLYRGGTVAGPLAVRQMIYDLAASVSETAPLVGIGSSSIPSRVFAVNPWWLRKHRIRYGRTLIYDDIDVALQVVKDPMLTLPMLPVYTCRHLGGNARDGCNALTSVARNRELKKLQELHPEITVRKGTIYVVHQG